jgi:hypothetical protein
MNRPGISHGHAIFAEFVLWASQRRAFPIYEDVMARFGCSYPTAQRWLAVYADAAKVDRPYRQPGGRRAA